MGTIREQLEAHEEEWLAPAAARSRHALRRIAEPSSEMRTEFQRDRDRIVHSGAFRRLKSKTQVFLPPAGDQVRTRLTHTLEVTQIARTIARALRLNEDLTEVIALAHDLGHTPFGHTGERALAELFPGFRHNEQSLRVVDVLEKQGRGLNLTNVTRDGILRHSKPDETITGALAGVPETAEAQIVKISDGVAYINHDLEDAVRAGILAECDVPAIVHERLGKRHSQRINTLVVDIIEASRERVLEPGSSSQVIVLTEPVREAADALRSFLFERVYCYVNTLPSTRQAAQILRELFQYYVEKPDALAAFEVPVIAGESTERRVIDFIASMTDRDARRRFERLFMPNFEEL
jgi:dGTPase